MTRNEHQNSVRSLHGVGRYLASGGADDRILLFDLKTNQELQVRQI